MSLGVAVFASVVLILTVYHEGFRKVVLRTGAVLGGLALISIAGIFGYDRYETWSTDRAAQKQKVAMEKGIRACMLRLGTPLPSEGTAPDFLPEAFFNNQKACSTYPDLDIPPPPPGFDPDLLPSGYMLDSHGRIAPIPPPDMIAGTRSDSPPIDLSAGLVPKPKKEAHVDLQATITCDEFAYDREMYAEGDREAIASLHTGDTVQYVGHVTAGDEEIIRVHGRKGYVSGCVDVKR
jgi:hypothetical protein